MLYVLATLLLYTTGYSLFNVPYMAMPGEMSGSYHERTAIMSFRVVFIQFGYLVGVGRLNAQENGYLRIYLNEPRNYRLTIGADF